MDILSDLLSQFGTFFQNSHLGMVSTLITSPWGEQQFEPIMTEAEEEMPPFARLVLAFGDVSVKTLATTPDSPLTQKIMGKMSLLHFFIRL